MKKKMTLALVLAFVFLFLSLGTNPIHAQNHCTMYGLSAQEIAESDAEIDALFGEGFAKNQRESREIFHQFYTDLPRTEAGEAIYPESYAGAYIGDDGRLVLLSANSVSNQTDSANREAFFDPIFEGLLNHRIVEFSYAQLNETRSRMCVQLDKKREAGCAYALNVIAHGIDHMQNVLLIHLYEYSESKIDGFKRHVIDSPMIAFKQGLKADFPESKSESADVLDVENYAIEPRNIRINPGERVSIRNPLLRQRGTMGYRVRRNSDNAVGFITSGHIFTGTGNRVYPHLIFSTHLGTVERRAVNSSIDASFVIANDNNQNSIGNTLPSGRTLSTFVPTIFFQNEIVTMYGATTGGANAGRVLDPNINYSFDNHRINGAVLTDVVSQRGDSGGVVVAGLLTGGIVWAGAAGQPHMLFIPAHRINSTFEVSRS